MPSVDFYITDVERAELFDFISINDGILIPKMVLDSPSYTTIKDEKELIDYISNRTVSFFILSPQFQKEPLVVLKLNDSGQYYISQRTGGPYIHISFFRGFADDSPVKQKSTEIFHYDRYMHYNSETYEEFKVSDELKDYYKNILRFLKSKCKQVVAKNGKKYWISKTLLDKEVY